MRKKSKTSIAPYKSGLEASAAKALLPLGFEYESETVPYVMEKNYTPDFVLGDIWVECKGRFRTFDEAVKYIRIKVQYPDKSLLFIVGNPSTKAYPQAKRRKDGTVLTIAEFLVRNGIPYISLDKKRSKASLVAAVKGYIEWRKIDRGIEQGG